MLDLDFAGWFQCRLATDPDAWDDPRGQLGWTFAMPGEADLDRVIRLQNPVAPRSHTPAVGVTVRAARQGGAPVANHPLLGGAVELLDHAVFDGRNGQIATAANEPIIPFHLQISRGEIKLIGRDPIDLTVPSELIRRQPVDFSGSSAEVRQVTDVPDAVAYRAARKARLQTDLAGEADATRRAALQRRIRELEQTSIRVTSLGFKLSYGFDLRGPNTSADPNAALVPAPDANAPWAVQFWMGGWDADALTGYVVGTLSVP